MREHFRISVRAKVRIAAADELVLERLIIFDHAVMDQRQLATRIKMWMRVFIVHFAMRGPARVADA